MAIIVARPTWDDPESTCRTHPHKARLISGALERAGTSNGPLRLLTEIGERRDDQMMSNLTRGLLRSET